MPNIVGITKDPKLLADLEKFCSEVGGDDLRFAGFETCAEFESLYFKKPQVAEESEEPVADLRLFSELQIILVAEDAFEGKAVDVIQELLKQTRIHGYWPEENRTRIIFLKFEEDTFDKLTVIHPAIEDLIFLPLDKPLLMQKLEIFLGLPELSKPSFLFAQEVKTEVEVSKIVTLERLNDCSLAIRNKVALKPGVRGKFYLAPPSSKNKIRFFGKAYRSEPHPDHPGEFLVYFFFFGVRKNEISLIRQWLGSDKKYHSLLDEDPKKFSFNADNMFLSEEDRRAKTVAIIDPDSQHSQNLKDFIERKADQISITEFSSYRTFFELGLSKDNPADFEPSPSDSKDLPAGFLKIKVDAEKKTLIHCEPPISPDLKFCGHAMDQLFVEGQNSWWKIFELKQNQVFFDDAYLNPGAQRVLFAQNTEGVWLGFNVTFNGEPSELSLDFQPLTSEQLLLSTPTVSQLKSIDALVIDTAFVSQNFDSWMTGLLDHALSVGAIKRREDLKIIFMSEKEDHLDEAWLKCDNVIAFILKPTDHKSVTVALAEALNLKYTLFTFSNLGWIRPGLRTHLSKPVELSQLSEFGAVINTSTPFKEGAFFFLRKGIFDEAPNGCLSARVYKTIPHPTDEGRFLAHATYYGINDFFLKHARSYMREQYAASKGKSGE